MASSSNIRSCLHVDLPPSTKKSRLSMDYKLCILCQAKSKLPLVNPLNFEKLIHCLKQRQEWLDPEYLHISSQLSNVSVQELQDSNAKWHKECYKKCTHMANMDRSKKHFEEGKRNEPKEDSEASTSSDKATYTLRSKTPAYCKNKCFFCDEGEKSKDTLYCIATDQSGERLKLAVQLSNSEILKVRLSDCTDPGDAHARDIKYHKQCWNKYVVNVLRPKYKSKCETYTIHEGATDVEFICTLSSFLHEGNVTTMADIEDIYRIIAVNNGIHESQIKSRKQIKKLIEEELESVGVIFSQPKRVNEPQRVSLKATGDASLAIAEDAYEELDKDMKCIFNAAQILRASVMKLGKWTFNGSLQKVDMAEVIPKQVYHFFKWCIHGHIDMKCENKKDAESSNKAQRLSQTFIYEMMAPRQASTAIDKKVRHRRDMPMQVAVGLTVHSQTRSKFLIQFLHGLGTSIEYGKVLRMETQIASEVIKCMEANGGIYIPPDLVVGRFIFCAADNIDFKEDTPYGKDTLHGTVMAVYQVEAETDTRESIILSQPPSRRSLDTIPRSLTGLSHGSISSSQKVSVPKVQPMVQYKEKNRELMDCSKLEDLLWMMAIVSDINRSSEMTSLDDHINENNENPGEDNNEIPLSGVLVPTWSAYQSLVNKPMKKMRVCVLPLIDSSPTTTSTQVTCMDNLERVTTAILGSDSKTVVTFDIGLYKPVCHLAMAKPGLSKNWVLRPGELHTVMAMLRAIGTFIEGTGLESTLSDLYGDAVMSQILAGKHVRRGIEAHKTLMLALCKCYSDLFFTHHKGIKDKLDKEIQKLIAALQTGNVTNINSVHKQTVFALKNWKILSKMEEFDNTEGEYKPTFKLARQYMTMVGTLFSYIRAVRTGNWELHLASLEDFVKYFFALDLRNYASMITWYLANIRQIEKTNPDLWAEFMKGNWVVNKSEIPFCALGADEALEHQNRAMKVAGGLVNLTQKKSALARFFFTAPELSRLATEAKNLIGMTEYAHLHHHNLTISKSKRQISDVNTVYNAMMNSTDPMSYDGNHLINISTKNVFNEDIQNDVSRMPALGNELYVNFKTERIDSDETYFWAKIKQVKLKLCKTAFKKVPTKVGETIVQLKADRSLFTRLLVVSRSRPDINLKESLGIYEFSAVPRSMFALDGTQLLCANKSKLMKLLEDQATATGEVSQDITDALPPPANQIPVTSSRSPVVDTPKKLTVAVLDGMAEVQAMKKTPSVKTCSDLANEFNRKLEYTLARYDETHLVFDTYRQHSLKSSMRQKRTGNTQPVQYNISDTTNIQKTSMKLLLSHTKTKDELTAYLSEKAIQYAIQRNKCLFVSWRETAKSSMGVVTNELKNNHEEADTKIILHSIFACRRGATQLHIYSPDTDVFILALWWYKLFPLDTMFVTGVGQNQRMINLSKVTDSLGPKKTSALLGLHALSGSDTTGTLAKKAKTSFWKVFSKAEDDILEGLSKLGSLECFLDEDRFLIEKFICQVYVPGTNISDIGELRWWMFTKKETQGENLPPTRASLTPYVNRVRYQTIEWCRADHPYPDLPSPLDFGWELIEKNNSYAPVMCMLPCAPQTALQVIRCSCVKRKCAPPCKCLSQNLKCTELCVCGGDQDMCDNHDDLTNNEDSTEDFDADDNLF